MKYVKKAPGWECNVNEIRSDKKVCGNCVKAAQGRERAGAITRNCTESFHHYSPQ